MFVNAISDALGNGSFFVAVLFAVCAAMPVLRGGFMDDDSFVYDLSAYGAQGTI